MFWLSVQLSRIGFVRSCPFSCSTSPICRKQLRFLLVLFLGWQSCKCLSFSAIQRLSTKALPVHRYLLLFEYPIIRVLRHRRASFVSSLMIYIFYQTLMCSDNLAYIYLWSMVETSVGTIAGSLHAIRKLFSSHFRFDSTTGSSTACAKPFSGTSQAVITLQSVAAGESNNNWERLDDNKDSTDQKIHVQVDLEMHSLERPQTPQDSDGSYADLVHLSRG